MEKNLLFIFSLMAFTFSCQKSPENLVIHGKVENPKENEIRLIGTDSTYTASLDSSGNFTLSIAWDTSNYAYFSHGNETSKLYLLPNSRLKLTVNTEEFDETISMTGDGAEASNYLLEKFLLEEKMPNAWERMQNSSPMEFKIFTDSVLKIKMNLLSSYEEKVHKAFYEYEVIQNKYDRISYLTNLLTYYHQNNLPLPEDSSYYDYRNEIDYNDPALLNTDNYYFVLSNEITLDALTDNLDLSDPEGISLLFERFIDAAKKKIKNQEVLGYVLSHHINGYKSYADINLVVAQLEENKEIFKEKTYNELVEVVNKIKSLSPGSKVPDFQFTSMDGSIVKLSDFLGKLVYIDLWATWCGPCIKEQPYMEKLIEEFKNRPVVFLAISVDDSPEPWKKMVKERNLSGIHLYAEDDWSSEIMTHFVVEGIPRYVLVDAQGRLINQNAPRPSGNIGEVLKQELQNI